AARWRAAGRPGSPADSAGANPAEPFGWARVQQAAAAFPGQPMLVVTSARLRSWQGSHRPLPAGVRWQVLPDTATTSWLAAAELVGDSLQLLVGQSCETQTRFRREKQLAQRHGQPIWVAGLGPVRFRANKNGGNGLVLVPASAPDADNGVGVEAVPPVIELYAAPEFAADARYLAAALRAAAVGMPVPPLLRRVQRRPTHLTTWTFWLSDEPLPPGLQQDVERSGSRLWREAAGPGVADTARLATTSAPAVAVFRRGRAAPAPGSETLWADGRGRALLSRQALGQGAVYQLHTRLSPAWSQLADDPGLPARLLALLQPEATDETAPLQPRNAALAQRLSRLDQRALDPAQLTTTARLQPAMGPPPAGTWRSTGLRAWLVLAVGLLFLLERLLARRRETQLLSARAS
ncbi:hypothetical protein, partial [Hymenobacter daeguensis]